MLNRRRTSCASACGSRPVDSTTMSTGMRRTKPASVSSTRMTSLPSSSGVMAQSVTSPTRPRMKCTPSSQQLVVELLVALARRAHVDVEVVDLGLGVLLEQVRQLQRIHAADARAPAVGLLVARADAVDDADGFGMLAVAQDHLAAGRAGGVDEALDLERGIHVGEGAVAVLGHALGVEGLEAGGDDDRADLDLLELLLLL